VRKLPWQHPLSRSFDQTSEFRLKVGRMGICFQEGRIVSAIVVEWGACRLWSKYFCRRMIQNEVEVLVAIYSRDQSHSGSSFFLYDVHA